MCILGGKPKKTNEQFVYELSVVKPNITPLEKYPNNNHTKMKVKCNTCGHIWSSTPQSLLQKCKNSEYNGCPNCAKEIRKNKTRKTHKQFVEELLSINRNIIPLEKYVNNNTKILCECRICHNEWMVTPDKLLSGRGCPECHYNKIRIERSYSRDEFINKLSHINSDIMLIGDYVNGRTKTTLYCKKCGFIWQATPFPLLKGVGCPHCNQSKGELKIKKYLKSKNINFETQKVYDDCKLIKPLRFDFYLPAYNLCIEFDGRQHFMSVDIFGGEEEFIKTKERDAAKNKYCKDNNIKLLRISYMEYDRIEDIISETIMHM